VHEKPIRKQLIEGRVRIQRLLDFLYIPSMIGLGGRPDKERTISMLETKLREIDETLAVIGGDHAKRP
jgi:hypothetical protein